LAAGKIAFQSGTQQGAIWGLAADTNQGRITGTLEKLTTEKANFNYVALTPDGKIMVFSSDRTGSRNDVFLRDIASGQERAIAADEPDKFKQFAQIDANGTEVVYTRYDATMSYDAYVVPVTGGARRKICSGCGPTNSLSPDGKQFLAAGAESKVNLVDVASGNSTLVLQQSRYPLSRPIFSADGKWIAFLVQHNAALFDVMLAPFRGATSVPEQDWIAVTPAPANVNQVFWSPGGGLLYYVTVTGGVYSLMARRLDQSRHPTGVPFRVFQFTGRIHPQISGRPNAAGDALTAVPGRFIGAMSEYSFNIWMMDLPK
jgi:Tol biopolymer transport system component